MKNIFKLTLLFMLFLTACNDDSNNNSINPPDWIQGTWFQEFTSIGFQFTNDDFCTVSGGLTSCFKNNINQSEGSTVEEEIDSKNYIITINASAAFSGTFHFRKHSETSIQAVVTSSSLDPIYLKQ